MIFVFLFRPEEWKIDAQDGSITIRDKQIHWVHTDRNQVRCVSNEKMIKGDFTHSFVVCLKEGYIEDQKNRGLIRLWEIRNDWDNRVWVYVRLTMNGWTIHSEQRNMTKDIWAYHGNHVFPFGDRFIVKMMRDNECYRLQVIEEQTKMVLEDSKWINGINTTFNWIWLVSSIRSRRNNDNWSTGYIENFCINNSNR